VVRLLWIACVLVQLPCCVQQAGVLPQSNVCPHRETICHFCRART